MTPAEHRFAAPDGEICWFEWGAPSEAPSLLLVHATGFHARCWDRVIAALPPGLHIIAPDLRGHGRSFWPETLGDWDAIAFDVVALARAVLPGRFFAAGHSMGGVVATHLAAELPDRVTGLLLIDPVFLSAEQYTQLSAGPRLEPDAHPVSRRRNQWDDAAQMAAHFAGRTPFASWQRDVLDDYCEYGLRAAPEGTGHVLACPPALEASAYLGTGRRNPLDLPHSVTCPATVLRGRNGDRAGPGDFSVSPTWPGVAGLFADGRDLQWNEHSHFIPMEDPGRTAALIAAMLDQ